MSDALDRIKAWIDSQTNTHFLIQKEEEGDVDIVNLDFEKMTIGHLGRQDPDGYVARETLLLHGKGRIQGLQDENQSARLPQEVYEIPLVGICQTDETVNQLQIQTERAVYRIKAH